MNYTFGSYLKFLRQRAGIKQSDLASFLGVSGAYASNVEKNHKNPITDPVKLQILFDKLQCSDAEADYLMDLTVEGRNTAAAAAPDIAMYLRDCPKARNAIRLAIRHKISEDDWDRFFAWIETTYDSDSVAALQLG